MIAFKIVLQEAKKFNFDPALAWLEQSDSDFSRINDTIDIGDGKKWGLLHFLADAENKKIETKFPVEITAIARLALIKGADAHMGDLENGRSGDTAFNIAAPSSPLIGKIMTMHWLKQALQEKGNKGLNDISGSHRSTLAQYIAKWFGSKEVYYIELAQQAGMKLAGQNASGWTPLMAAGALGNFGAFRFFLKNYSDDEKKLRSTELYSAPYGVGYTNDLDAGGIIKARLEQDTNLSVELKKGLEKCLKLWQAKTKFSGMHR